MSPEIAVGFYGSKKNIEIMAVVDGYVMYRFRNSIPTCSSAKNFKQILGKLKPTKQ